MSGDAQRDSECVNMFHGAEVICRFALGVSATSFTLHTGLVIWFIVNMKMWMSGHLNTQFVISASRGLFIKPMETKDVV